MGKSLTEKMSVKGPAYAHRLLTLLDELPTLGRPQLLRERPSLSRLATEGGDASRDAVPGL
jgi:hypothetical protein